MNVNLLKLCANVMEILSFEAPPSRAVEIALRLAQVTTVSVMSLINDSPLVETDSLCWGVCKTRNGKTTNKAWFSYVGKIPDDLGFHCFPTVPDFPDLWKLKIVDIPDRLGWTGTNLENRERFYFPDASQISTMVGDHSRQMKTQILTVKDVGVRRQWILPITKPLNCWAPVPLSQINMAENMASLSRSNGYLYLESLAQEAKKTDTAFMDIRVSRTLKLCLRGF